MLLNKSVDREGRITFCYSAIVAINIIRAKYIGYLKCSSEQYRILESDPRYYSVDVKRKQLVNRIDNSALIEMTKE